MYASRTRKEEFSGHDENCQQDSSDLEGSLVTSSGPATEKARRPNIERWCLMCWSTAGDPIHQHICDVPVNRRNVHHRPALLWRLCDSGAGCKTANLLTYLLDYLPQCRSSHCAVLAEYNFKMHAVFVLDFVSTSESIRFVTFVCRGIFSWKMESWRMQKVPPKYVVTFVLFVLVGCYM